MLKRGVYAASLSVLNKDLTLNVEATISHAEKLIKNGLHGCFFFGSTGMSQLISKNEKMELISKISTHKLKKQFFLGTGCNSLNENIELIKCLKICIKSQCLIELPCLKMLWYLKMKMRNLLSREL